MNLTPSLVSLTRREQAGKCLQGLTTDNPWGFPFCYQTQDIHCGACGSLASHASQYPA